MFEFQRRKDIKEVCPTPKGFKNTEGIYTGRTCLYFWCKPFTNCSHRNRKGKSYALYYCGYSKYAKSTPTRIDGFLTHNKESY